MGPCITLISIAISMFAWLLDLVFANRSAFSRCPIAWLLLHLIIRICVTCCLLDCDVGEDKDRLGELMGVVWLLDGNLTVISLLNPL
jgi:hypothetical protein